jgi:hypothetical protein
MHRGLQDREALAVTMSWHCVVFTENAMCERKYLFERDGKMVWSCNAAQAEANFDPKPFA